jgi:hypothetical protein
VRHLAISACLAVAVVAAGDARAQPSHLAPGDVAAGAIEAEPPEIDLLTFGVGERIFEKFGHAAICLHYHQPEHPGVCFNYGVTDFTAGLSMVWTFLRGTHRFWVEPTSLASMLQFYEWEDRDIWRQRLPITGDDARLVEARLWSDIREENRYYYYDHFLDNCATRVRDLIDQATHGALRAGSDAPFPRTYRELGRRGLAGMPLLLVLSDLVTGRPLDEHPTQWRAMFHPGYLRGAVAGRLGANAEMVYRRRGPPFPLRGSSGRLDFLAIAVALALPLLVARTFRRHEGAALMVVAIALALLAGLVWGAAIVSAIPAVRINEALLIALPTDIALPLLSPVWRRRYARLRLCGLAALVLLAIAGVLHQPLMIVILAVALPMLAIAFDVPHSGLIHPA